MPQPIKTKEHLTWIAAANPNQSALVTWFAATKQNQGKVVTWFAKGTQNQGDFSNRLMTVKVLVRGQRNKLIKKFQHQPSC